MKYLWLVTIVLLCAIAQAQDHNAHLMTPAEYTAFLATIDTDLPVWEAALKRVDPAKANVPYAAGKQIEDHKALGLREAGWAREWVAKQRVKHTVSGELGLKGFLQSLYDEMDSVNSTAVTAGIDTSGMERYAPEFGSLVIRIDNDLMARVELLEKATCP